MALVQLPDGTLAHFEDGVSPEELREHIVPDLPDALLDQQPAPAEEPAPYVPYRRPEDIDTLDLPVPGMPAQPPQPAYWYDNLLV
ncbi:hypothetical protein [Devosia nitrariae]|uniref:Uncharacterized protein n=1 Tax=Devosia nitrariae TaxID=2071872 RepID=A0ABQ5W1K2_9HYPH|nr:hypothetical protein [Devosia nitrariae]GLQ53751.1 hypothetical protein GCM10010862_10100 [Devosia nitrariae]